MKQPYKGCPLTCLLAEITRNETVWRMRTNNVKRVYCRVVAQALDSMMDGTDLKFSSVGWCLMYEPVHVISNNVAF